MVLGVDVLLNVKAEIAEKTKKGGRRGKRCFRGLKGKFTLLSIIGYHR